MKPAYFHIGGDIVKTRFDNAGVWCTTGGRKINVEDMSTVHLMNTIKMLTTKLSRSLFMLISDIEGSTFADTVWTPFGAHSDDKQESLKNVTSLSPDELRAYIVSTPLYQSMLMELELERRGVNVENLSALTADPSF